MSPEVPAPILLSLLERMERQLDGLQAELAQLREEGNQVPALLTTREAARLMRKSEDWMRTHAGQFFASKVGDGPKAELLFPRSGIDTYLEAHRVGRSASSTAPEDERKKRRRRKAAIAAAPEMAATGTSVMSWD